MVLIGYHASGTVQWTQEEGAGVLLLAQELSVARHAAICCPSRPRGGGSVAATPGLCAAHQLSTQPLTLILYPLN